MEQVPDVSWNLRAKMIKVSEGANRRSVTGPTRTVKEQVATDL